MRLPLIDISTPLNGVTPTWPGSPGFSVRPLLSLANGDPANTSWLEMDVHTGTHVDAPLHCLADGEPTESMALDAMTGAAYVADFTHLDAVDPEALDAAGIPAGTTRLLLRTRNSTDRARRQPPFREDFAALTVPASRWIVEHGIVLVGIDYCSIQRYTDPVDTHLVLLNASVVILEGLDLVGAPSGDYELLCLPLSIPGIEAAPARAMLRPMEA